MHNETPDTHKGKTMCRHGVKEAVCKPAPPVLRLNTFSLYKVEEINLCHACHLVCVLL